MLVRPITARQEMPQRVRPAWLFPHKDVTAVERVGGHVALDFANTVSWRHQPREVEYLKEYRSLASWSRATGLISRREESQLLRLAQRAPRRAVSVLTRARALREAIFRVGQSIARGRPVPADAASIIHGTRLTAWHHAHFAAASEGTWSARWEGATDLARPLWPIAIAFAELLEHPGPHPLGMCPGCSWLFLDLSRNGSRQWCSSGDCGNRERGRRFRVRHRE